MKLLLLIVSFAFLVACAHQRPQPNLAEQFTRVEQITLELKRNKITYDAILDNAAQSPLSRQIEAAFAFDPTQSHPQMLMHAAATAFRLPFAIAVDDDRRAILQRDVDAILALLLAQERRHAFHGNVSAEAAARKLEVEIVDKDDAGIVRANCEAGRARLSTGFIRRLLERAVASATNGMFSYGAKPDLWPTDADGNWPPSLLASISGSYAMADAEGITMSKTVRRMFELEHRLETEIIPALDVELAKRGMRSVQSYINQDEEALIDEVVEELADEVRLSGKPKRDLDQLLRTGRAMTKRADEDPNSRESRELASFEEEFEAFGDGMERVFETYIFARFAQEQYLKALAFTVAHEAAHLWIDGCALPTSETENFADAFAALVSFELFHNHQSRVTLKSVGGLDLLEMPELPKDDRPFTDLIADALGWSGFDLVAETFGQSGIAPDASHDDFKTRQNAVRDLYLQLVQTAVAPTTPQ